VDLIITGDLYQAPPIQNNWVFQRKFDSNDALAINFWLDCIHCFKLTHVMHQTDDQFIEVFKRF
jgi:hypothetical protein